MLTLDLVRHAEPDWAPDGVGVVDPSLSELGQTQAERLADAYADNHMSHFYVSPLARAQESASPIAKRLGHDPVTLDWSRELELFSTIGLPWPEIEEFFLRYRARSLEEWWKGPDGDEDYHQFFTRVQSGVDDMLDEEFGTRPVGIVEDRLYTDPNRTGTILMVAHIGTIGAILCHLMEFDLRPWLYEKMLLGYAGICRLRTVPLAGQWVWALTSFNDRTHLGEDIL